MDTGHAETETAAQPRDLNQPYSEATGLWAAEYDSLDEALAKVAATTFAGDPDEIDIHIYTTDRGYAVEITTKTTRIGS